MAPEVGLEPYNPSVNSRRAGGLPGTICRYKLLFIRYLRPFVDNVLYYSCCLFYYQFLSFVRFIDLTNVRIFEVAGLDGLAPVPMPRRLIPSDQ